MIDQSAVIFMLIAYLAPLVFVIWAILAAVGALNRIATALESQTGSKTPAQSKPGIVKVDDPSQNSFGH